MRVAVLILGLVLGALMFFQTFLVYALSGLASDRATGQSGAVGLVMALLWLIASALVFPVPLVSVVAFAIAALLGFSASARFPDLQVWGVASAILAVMSLLAWVAKRRGAARDARREALEGERHAQLLRAVGGSPLPVTAAFAVDHAPVRALAGQGNQGVPCTSCGAENREGAKYCGACGASLP